jgi:hypothetical protein
MGMLLGIVIGLVIGVILRPRPERVRAEPLGFTQDEMAHQKEAARGCWQCGDYVCVEAGSSFAIGARMRICGPPSNPRWKGSCPTFTELGDGSKWQFQANCRCDG